MSPTRPKVLVFVGSGRSGTTLVNSILGQVPGMVAAGEVRYLWSRGILEHGVCGCGETLERCPLWSQVIADPRVATHDPAAVDRSLQQRLRIREIARRMLVPPSRRPRLEQRPEDGGIVGAYQAISDASGGSVVVDSSKLPPYALLLSGAKDLDLVFLHLSRDPRATAYSWQRSAPSGQVSGHEEDMDQFSLVKASALWLIWNLASRLWWPTSERNVIRARYEDFVADPQALIAQVCAACGVTGWEDVFVDHSTVNLGPTHTVAGNPNRHRQGPTKVRSDDEWTAKMSLRDKLAVTLIDLPGILVLGHRAWPTMRPSLRGSAKERNTR